MESILHALTTGYTPFILFFIWSAFSLWIGAVRIYEFIAVQRTPSTVFFAVVNLAQSVALGIAALLVAPHPLFDFEYLRPWSRLAWAVGLPFFLIAVPVHTWYVGRIVYLRWKTLNSPIVISDVSPYASLEDK